MSKDSNDTALVMACLAGDRKAFEALVEHYQKPIFNVAYRMLQNTEEARDVTQTVFLKTYENLDRYDSSHKFFSWICRIAINESINVQTSRRHQQAADDSLASTQPGPDSNASNVELHQGLEDALMGIKPDFRAVIVLKHLTGLSYAEISETLDIPEKTVKSRLHDAREQLRELLNKESFL